MLLTLLSPGEAQYRGGVSQNLRIQEDKKETNLLRIHLQKWSWSF